MVKFWILILKNTENILREEANFKGKSGNFKHDASDSVLQTYQSEGDSDSYTSFYYELRNFIDSTLDVYKVSFQ